MKTKAFTEDKKDGNTIVILVILSRHPIEDCNRILKHHIEYQDVFEKKNFDVLLKH